jgi:1-acyl-sn-glycerol-3-phosphate acyltransferase
VVTDRDPAPVPALGRVLWRIGPPLIRVVGRIGFSLGHERLATLPPPPFVIAANHFSHLDPPAIGAVLGGPIRYLALDELAGANRFLAGVLPTFGAIPVSRTRLPIAAIRSALSCLERGEVVGVFPEGGRVARWGDAELKRGAAWLAIRAGVPLVPVAVIGTDHAMGLDNRVGRAAIRVVVGPPLSPRDADPTILTERWSLWIESQLFPGLLQEK